MHTIAGAILAGGRGARLGGIVKAKIEIGGQRLIDRAIASLVAANLSPILISIGDYSATNLRLPRDFPAINDDQGPTEGPVAGLVAVVNALENRSPEAVFLQTMAVDTLVFPGDFPAMANEMMNPETAVVFGAYQGQIYPTNALWRLDVLRDALKSRLPATASPGLRHLLPAGVTKLLDLSAAPTNPFFNINTPQDLAQAQAMFGDSGPE